MKNDERIFAVGDTHGHFDELLALEHTLERRAGFRFGIDHLVLLGDLVDNGHQVKQLIEHVRELQQNYPGYIHPIRGNHEDLLLDAFHPNHPTYGDYYLWHRQGGAETLKSFIPEGLDEYEKAIYQPEDAITKDVRDWLDSLPYYWETDKYFFVHGGVMPGTLLKDHDFNDPHIKYNMLWIRDRFIQSTFKWEKLIVFGHTAQSDPKGQYSFFKPWVMKNKIGINTLPRNIGHLTAVELPAEKFWVA